MPTAETTRSLIIGLFALTGRPVLTLPEVARLAAPLGVGVSNLKSHLTRMALDGSITRRGEAGSYRYEPTPRKRFVMAAIDARLAGTTAAWNGEWIMLALEFPADRRERERAQRHLDFDGFRRLSVATFVRPAWPLPWAGERAGVHAERLDGCFVMGRLAGYHALERVLAAYALDKLESRARKVLARIAACEAESPSPERAFRERVDIGGRVAQLFAEDPRLPPELWGDRRALRELTRAYAAFERSRRAACAPFLADALGGAPSTRFRRTASGA